MQYLTPQDLRKIAPATQKMPQSDENLVSTKTFLRRVEKMGYHPIFAAQGTAHADADQPLKSRHLIAVSNKEGIVIALLNSHSIWRRAWIGIGFAGHTPREFILGAKVPLPRWKGFEESLETALSYKDSLAEAWTALGNWALETHQARWMAKQFAASAWLKGHKQPATKTLSEAAENETAADSLLIFLSLARAGGLPPAPIDSYMPARRLKPVAAPDAVMHATHQAFQVGLAALRKYDKGDFEPVGVAKE